MSRPRDTIVQIKNRIRGGAATALLCAMLVTGAARPAHAAFDPATVTAYAAMVEGIFRALNEIKSFFGFGNAGPDIGALLAQVKEQLVAEMRSQRNQALVSNTRSVFNLFVDLSDNRLDDPTNVPMWTNIRTLMQVTADQMFDIIEPATDRESAYQLVPAYNALIATGAAVHKMKQELFRPAYASWADHYNWLQPAMQANYKAISSQQFECYPGYNPGYMPNIVRPVRLGKFMDSQIWKKVTNKAYHVKTIQWEGVCRNEFFTSGSSAVTCNPSTNTCVGYPIPGNSCSITSQVVTWKGCGSTLSDLNCAREKAKVDFDKDNVVKMARTTMRSIQRLSLGNDYDAHLNDPYLLYGGYVDPWVHEPSCPQPYAYPQLP